MRYLRKFLSLCALGAAALVATAEPSYAQLNKIKTVWVIVMENHTYMPKPVDVPEPPKTGVDSCP